MKKLKLKKNNLIVLLVLLLVIGGSVLAVTLLSGRKEDTKGYTNKPKEEEPTKPVDPDIQIVDPTSKSRPFAVMINNLGTARPYHSGLQDAYLVYEIIVEGGITRYLALFKDKTPEIVGSVRSARHYYLDYVLENDAYYVHWGWSPQAQEDIRTLGVNNINGIYESSPYFFRKNYANIPVEHKGYASLLEISKLVKSKGYRSVSSKGLLLDYSASPINPEEKGTTANKLDLRYSGSFVTNYVYDEASNSYKQSVNNTPHVDYQTKKQYTVKNILVYQVGNTSIAGDQKGRQDLDNLGSGEGYFITGGISYPITWEKENRASQTIYRYKETGKEIIVNDGNTWIHIVPTSGSVSIN